MKLSTKFKSVIKWCSFGLALLGLIFSVTEHYDVWDNLRCTNDLKGVVYNLKTTEQNVKKQFRPVDQEWKCLIDLIYKYSLTKFPEDRDPKLIGRGETAISHIANYPGQIFEWSVPIPVIVGFKDQQSFENQDDYVYIGTVKDIENWIERDKNDFNFAVKNIFLGVLSLVLMFVLLILEFPKSKT